jgi:ribosomal protein S6--L-glutamate ligase
MSSDKKTKPPKAKVTTAERPSGKPLEQPELKPVRRSRSAQKRVAILSRKRSLYSTTRLVEAAKARGHRAIVLDTLRCNMVLASGAPRMTYRAVEIRGVDVVIPRIGASITGYGLAVVNHFDMMNVPVINNSIPIARSRDKLRCLQLLAHFGIDIPRTVMAGDRSNVPKLIEEVGGLPAIIKLIRGTQGVGVMIASTLAEVQTILDTFWDLGQEIVLQEFISESRGRDVRALVVGDRVVGAMRRRAKKGEFGRVPVEPAPRGRGEAHRPAEGVRGGGGEGRADRRPGDRRGGHAGEQPRPEGDGDQLQPGLRGAGGGHAQGHRRDHDRPRGRLRRGAALRLEQAADHLAVA